MWSRPAWPCCAAPVTSASGARGTPAWKPLRGPFENFLWVTFTRSDPAADVYGADAATRARHWSCEAPLLIDARVKPFHAPALEEDPAVERRVEALAAPGGPLHGLL